VNTSPAGIALIKQFETCRLAAYPDPRTGAAPWTVGWGATGPEIAPGTIWEQSQADARLMIDIGVAEAIVAKAATVPLTQGQFDALVSIVFNVGPGSPYKDGIVRLKDGRPSTLLRLLNAGDYDGAADQFLYWISPGSSVENGLKRRRTAERCMFLSVPGQQPSTAEPNDEEDTEDDSTSWGNEVRQ
jgi:lysozyme